MTNFVESYMSKLKNSFIIFESSKAYSLGKSFRGFHSGGKKSLEDLPSYVGYYVHLHLSHPYLGMNDIEGDIIMIENDTLILQYKDKARVKKANLLLSTIDRARLAIKF